MRIFFDFEFIENGSEYPIIPISVGIVREDEKTYYAEFSGIDWSKANDWVLANVKPYIGKITSKPKKQIANEIKKFVGSRPEFWAYYADYDWVILCQLYGRMIDLPEGWPMCCFDLKQYMWHLGLSRSDIPFINEEEHNALADAEWDSKLFNMCFQYQQSLMQP
jgi:hypothetical protein